MEINLTSPLQKGDPLLKYLLALSPPELKKTYRRTTNPDSKPRWKRYSIS